MTWSNPPSGPHGSSATARTGSPFRSLGCNPGLETTPGAVCLLRSSRDRGIDRVPATILRFAILHDGETRDAAEPSRAQPSRGGSRKRSSRRPYARMGESGAPPASGSRSTPTTAGCRGASPSAPTGRTGSKPSGNSTRLFEGDGGTCRLPAARVTRARLRLNRLGSEIIRPARSTSSTSCRCRTDTGRCDRPSSLRDEWVPPRRGLVLSRREHSSPAGRRGRSPAPSTP